MLIFVLVPVTEAGGKTAREQALERELKRVRAELAKRQDENQKLRFELDFLRNENAVQRKELIETLDKYSTQAGNLRRIEKGVAGTIETLEPAYLDARAMELAADLHLCISYLRKLSGEVLNFADETGKKLPELITDNVELARLRMQLDSLKSGAIFAARIAMPPGTPGQASNCRILELNREWKLAILSGGTREGVRIGMILEAGKVKLKVVAVRNFVCAAAVTAGSFDELAVGRWAVVAHSRQK